MLAQRRRNETAPASPRPALRPLEASRVGERVSAARPIGTDEPAQWQIQVFFDGECPLCVREIAMLSRLDRRDRIWFTDIASVDFDAARWGTSWGRLMEQIRGRLPDGQWIEGVEVFRRLYGAVGFAALVPLTRLPIVEQVLDFAYDKFAKNRLRWTGRCADGACVLPAGNHARAAMGWRR